MILPVECTSSSLSFSSPWYLEKAHTRQNSPRRLSFSKNWRPYSELLADYYYRSDHVTTAWSDAAKELKRHSAYNALSELCKDLEV